MRGIDLLRCMWMLLDRKVYLILGGFFVCWFLVCTKSRYGNGVESRNVRG